MQVMDVKFTLPLLPLRDIVVFPSMVIPLFVGRDKSISALNEVMKKDKKIILVTQKNSEVDDPKKTDVFTYGCEGTILQLLKLPDGTVKVLVEGKSRCIIDKISSSGSFLTATINLAKETKKNKEISAHQINRLSQSFEKFVKLNGKIKIIAEIKVATILINTNILIFFRPFSTDIINVCIENDIIDIDKIYL